MNDDFTILDITWNPVTDTQRMSGHQNHGPAEGLILLPNGWAVQFVQNNFEINQPHTSPEKMMFNIGIMRPLTRKETSSNKHLTAPAGTLVQSILPPKAMDAWSEIMGEHSLQASQTIHDLVDFINIMASIEGPTNHTEPELQIPKKYILEQNTLGKNQTAEITQLWKSPIHPATGKPIPAERFRNLEGLTPETW